MGRCFILPRGLRCRYHMRVALRVVLVEMLDIMYVQEANIERFDISASPQAPLLLLGFWPQHTVMLCAVTARRSDLGRHEKVWRVPRVYGGEIHMLLP